MFNIFRRPLYTVAVFFIGFLVLSTACTRPEDEIGIDLQPDEDILSASEIDTFTVRAFTEKEDSVSTDKWETANVGAYTDPIFGFSKAGHVTEIRLSTANPDFVPDGSTLADVIIDSLILNVSYTAVSDLSTDLNPLSPIVSTRVYGSLDPQFLRLYELAENLSVDDRYYDSREPRIDGDDLIKPGFNLFTPNKIDSDTTTAGVQVLPLRFPLRDELGYRIIEASAESGLTAEAFRELLKGLYFEVDESQVIFTSGGIVYFNSFNSATQITMYYRNVALGDTLSYDFPIRSNTGKYNYYQHDYSQIEQGTLLQQLNGETELGGQDLYIQSMGGTKVRVELPFLENLRNTPNVSINKAVLSIPVRVDEVGIYNIPDRLFLFGRDEDGRIFLLQDALDGREGGRFNTTTKSYEFFITRYVQDVLSGRLDHFGLELASSRAGYTANRVVLNGPEYPDAAAPLNNMKFSITFTQF